MKKKIISIVTPVYNEELTLDRYFERVLPLIDQLKKYDFELIFTNNCSTDKTQDKILKYQEKYPFIGLINFSKNFGYQSSILAGYLQSKGEAVLQLDCDLQDPPELLGEFLKHWEDGHQIVYGVRLSRKESVFSTFLRKTFYRLINLISSEDLPHDAGDFMLIDRVVLNNLKLYNLSNFYLRGLIFSQGFKKIGITYDRSERLEGESKFPFFKMLSLAIDGIIGHSILPLRIATFVGISLITLSIFLGAFYISLYFYSQSIPAGFTTIVIILLALVGLNSMFLGIIGEYIARIYTQTRNDPYVIIESQYKSFFQERNLD